MKKTLVIGSTVADVIITVPCLPERGGDANILSETVKLGGCAFNVSEILRAHGVPYTLCSPVGGGVYGDFVAAELERLKVPCFVRLPQAPNGCCYCIVDSEGERTFLSKHGSEYLFSCEWMTEEVCADADSVYACGIELEEPSGEEIIRFLESQKGLKVFFAPSARLTHIPPERVAALLKMRPVVHLNETEAFSLTGERNAERAALAISRETQNAVIITLGERGAYCLPAASEGSKGTLIPAAKVSVKDTIGAGDAHFGAVIASLKQGYSLEAAVERANKVAAAIVSGAGRV